MKMKKYLVYGIVAMVIVATSCEKKNEEGDGGDKYSPIPVEEHKANIEDEGLDMLDEMKLMENEPAMDANISLMSILQDSDPFSGNEGMKKGAVLNSIAMRPVVNSVNVEKEGISKVLKSTLVSPLEEDPTIQGVYDELVGTYEWNSSTYEWDYTEGGSAIIFKFPSEEGGSSNNASYTITYVGYTGPHPLKNDEEFGYEGDIPQNIAAILEIDGSEASKFTFDVVYNGEGYPTSVDVVFSVGTFVWSGNLTNTINEAFDASVSFTHGDVILIKATLGASGDWSEDNIEDNINTVYYADYYDEELGYYVWKEIDASEVGNYEEWEVDSWEELDIHKVITDGNASLQLMNLKIVGEIDAEGLGDKLEEIEDTYDWDTQAEEANEAEIEAFNEFVNLTLRYADNNNIIAMVEAYPVEETYTWTDWVWNDNLGDYEEVQVTETDYWMDMRFVFADESKVDFETYFTEGFDELVDEIEAWADDIEETYGK